MSVLQNVLLEAANDRLCLTATDFDNWRAVFPAELPIKAIVPADAFRSCLERAAIIAQEAATKEEIGLVSLDLEDGVLVAKAQGQAGYSEEVIHVTGTGAVKVWFNVRYLLDAVKACGGEEVEMAFKDDGSACVFTGADGYRHLVLPVIKRGGEL